MRPAPILKPVGSSLFVVYAPCEACAGITLEFSRLVEGRDTITAEITITTEGAGEIAWDRINLLASRTRQSLAKTADEKSPEAPWREVVEESCRLVVKRLRAGDPPVALLPQEPSPEEQCLVPGLIFRDEVNLIFADGGSTKSLFALALTMAGVLGRPLSKVWTVGPIKRALYLDWESNRSAHAKRLWGLASFMERPPDGSIQYLRMTRPLIDQIDAIQGECDRQGIDAVVADSLAPASGLEPEGGDASIRTLQAMRSLGRTVICLAHMSKNSADGHIEPRPYGSVFNTNLARSTIQLKPEGEPDADGKRLVTLIHRKVNDGRFMAPSSIEWEFLPSGEIRCHGGKVSTEYLSLKKRIEAAIAHGRETVGVIADLVGSKESVVRAALNEMKSVGDVLRFGDPNGGRGNKVLWGLVDRNRRGEA